MKNYKKLIIYYLSGTGNSLKAANWIADEVKTKGIEVIIHPIDKNYKPDMTEIDDDTLVGFHYPTHGFNLAPAMMYFIMKFPKRKNIDVYLLNTRAGMRIGKVHFPGLSGSAQLLPMLILKLKGFNVKGGLALDMPSNWISIHPGFISKSVEFITNRCEKTSRNFINKIFDGKKVFKKVLVSLPVDIPIMYVAFFYYVIGRFVLAKTLIYTSDCDGCKICVNNCPVGAIKLKNDRPYWTFDCESCMRCINFCPKRAIQVPHLFVAIFMIVLSYPFVNLVYDNFTFLNSLNNAFFKFIINWAITLSIVFVLYYILNKLLGNKIINYIFKYTSFTTYWRLYRAIGVKANSFK